MTNEAMVAVEQCDRDAAAHFIEAHGWLCEETWSEIHPLDQEVIAKAFARHRQARPSTGWREEDVERVARIFDPLAFSGNSHRRAWVWHSNKERRLDALETARAALAALSPSAEPGVSREELLAMTSGEIVGMTLGDEGTPEYAEAFKAGFHSAMGLVRALLTKERQDG